MQLVGPDGVLFYPVGYAVMPDGTKVDNQDLAQQILEGLKPGGIFVLPSVVDEHGVRLWDYKWKAELRSSKFKPGDRVTFAGTSNTAEIGGKKAQGQSGEVVGVHYEPPNYEILWDGVPANPEFRTCEWALKKA